MAFTLREAVIISASDLETDGPNQHVRAQVRCTDGPPDIFYVLILNDAAKHLTSLRESGRNPTLILAGHLHSWTDDYGKPQVELALTHLGVSLPSDFIWPDNDRPPRAVKGRAPRHKGRGSHFLALLKPFP